MLDMGRFRIDQLAVNVDLMASLLQFHTEIRRVRRVLLVLAQSRASGIVQIPRPVQEAESLRHVDREATREGFGFGSGPADGGAKGSADVLLGKRPVAINLTIRRMNRRDSRE